MRPAQAVLKNGFVLTALVFAQKLTDKNSLILSLFAYVVFCLLSGCVYVMNDIFDRREDAAHPVKKSRPIASGKLSPDAAWASVFIICSLSIAVSLLLNTAFAFVAIVYLLISILYSLFLKEIVILDALTVGAGFVLRAVAGTVILKVEISPWFLVCTLLLSLFLAFSKRRYELTLLSASLSSGAGEQDRASALPPHRKVLDRYSAHLLDQIIAVTTSATLVTYLLYTMDPGVAGKFHTKYLSLTVPFVLYGIFRYLYLVHRMGEGGRPAKTLLSDKPLLLTVLFWILAAMLIIYVLPHA
jgi:hypothetical protein